MFPAKYPVPQSEPPLPPRETLPTMYDLPSENPEEPGLPDEFHDFQPQLLSQTFRPPQYQASRVFCGSDKNIQLRADFNCIYLGEHAQFLSRLPCVAKTISTLEGEVLDFVT